MAQRPKSAAQIAEEKGQLNDPQILNTVLIRCMENQTEELRQDLYEINRSLSYAIGSVMAIFNTKNLGKEVLNIEELTNIDTTIKILDREILRVGDILVADYGNQNIATLGLANVGLLILGRN